MWFLNSCIRFFSAHNSGSISLNENKQEFITGVLENQISEYPYILSRA
jgi:hypothetical protein